MQFGLLGPVEVCDDGGKLALGGAKQRALLADLLIHANDVVSVDRLIDDLWGDTPPDSATNALQTYVAQLRKVLEPERQSGAPGRVLQTVAPGYVLKVGRDQLDVTRFEERLRRGQELVKPDPAEAATLLGDALSLWRGPALADVADAAFAQAEAARLEDLRVVALESRIEAELAVGRHSDLVSELEILVKQHPLRERLCGLLMLCLYRSGRQAEASQVYQRIRERLVEELGMEPGPELQQLLEQILNQDPAIAAQKPHEAQRSERTNLPLELSSFVGRGAEVEEVKRLLQQTRLVTLTGAGGIGKTRLALAVASQVVDDYDDGVWVVELAGLTDGELVPQIVLATLGFEVQPGLTPLESLIRALAERETLCVIDNCEHLVEGCARLTDRLLRRCPRLRILATSRDVLGVAGEIIWRVPPLATEPERPGAISLEAVKQLEAVQLLVERAAAARAGFRLGEDNAASVVRICQRLDGIPLAIELAAARMRALSVTAIEAHLDHCFQFLTGGSRASLPRQQTLQATLDWSHDLLTENEKRVFRRLSVFLGGFTLAAAGAVCADEELDGASISVVDAVTSLVEKSLVVWEEGSDRSGRYRLLEPVRQYAQLHLLNAGEIESTRLRHAMFYSAFGEEAYRELRGPHQPVWVGRVQDEFDNLRACFDWATQYRPRAALQLFANLERYWMLAVNISEFQEWVARIMQTRQDRDELWAYFLWCACHMAKYPGDYDEARRFGQASLSIARELGDASLTGSALTALAGVESEEGREGWVAIAIPLCEEAEPLLRRAASPDWLAHQLNRIGGCLHSAGDLTGAAAKFEEALGLGRTLSDTFLTHSALANLARVEFDAGKTSAAARHAQEALALAGEMHSLGFAPGGLRLLARVAIFNQQPERGVRLLAAGATLQQRAGRVLDSQTQREVTEACAAAERIIGPEAADAAWREGAQMSFADAVRYGIEPDRG